MRVTRMPAVLVAAISLLLAPPASAEEPAGGEPTPQQPERSRLLGIHTEVGLASGFGTTVVGTSGDATVIAGSYGNLRLGYDFPVGVTALLYLGYASVSSSATPAGNARAERAFSGSVFALGVEGRYYFLQKRTRPFAFVGLTKTFVSLGETTGGDPVQEPIHNLDADRADTFGVSFGGGAEHGFTRQFAIGGRWGLDLTFRSATDNDTDVSSNRTNIGTAAELYAAFRF